MFSRQGKHSPPCCSQPLLPSSLLIRLLATPLQSRADFYKLERFWDLEKSLFYKLERKVVWNKIICMRSHGRLVAGHRTFRKLLWPQGAALGEPYPDPCKRGTLIKFLSSFPGWTHWCFCPCAVGSLLPQQAFCTPGASSERSEHLSLPKRDRILPNSLQPSVLQVHCWPAD